MMKMIMSLIAACALAGCAADSGMAVAGNQVSGNGRITLDPANPRRLTVTLLNLRDLGGYDFDRPGDREAFVRGMLTRQCGAPSIVDGRVTETGGTSLRALKLYFLTIDCPNGASRKAE